MKKKVSLTDFLKINTVFLNQNKIIQVKYIVVIMSKTNYSDPLNISSLNKSPLCFYFCAQLEKT